MTRKGLFDHLKTRLSTIYPAEESGAMVLNLLEAFYRLERSDLVLSPEAEIEVIPELEEAVGQLLTHRPLQYVLGRAWCYDLPFYVDERVLIPRPETEELIRWIVADCHTKSPALLDIGTGSGCIAVSLAHELPRATVSAVDISPEAIAIARRNAIENGVTVNFSLLDILQAKPVGLFDVIVSNPPYVLDSERPQMRRNVLDYEPAIALFVPDCDPLRFYRAIADYAREGLRPGGALYFEINEQAGEALVDMLTSLGFGEVELRRDIFDKNRMIRALWK